MSSKLPQSRRLLQGLILIIACLGVISCGGGGSSSNNSTPLANNQMGIAVSAGPPSTNVINALYATITLCAVGTANCQTIDHLLVDTGSSGVRIVASAIQSSLLSALPLSSMAECLQFVSGYTWGSIRPADITLGNETAHNAMVQIIADPALPSAPTNCSNTGTAWDTVSALGAKGIIGISTFAQDCGQSCVTQQTNGYYYSCSSSSCTSIAVAIDKQVWNPVALFTSGNNNGTIINLPAIPSSGASSVNGTLTFGIGTQANNGVGSTAVLKVDPAYGEFFSSVDGTSYTGTNGDPGSFIDSGSNGLFYGSDVFPICSQWPGFYCPPSPTGQNGILTGYQNFGQYTTNFTVSNPSSLAANIYADAELAGTGYGGVDWGLPFFFGRTVYTAIEGMMIPGATNGPWVGIGGATP
jgi:hypothetical protein